MNCERKWIVLNTCGRKWQWMEDVKCDVQGFGSSKM